jgi:hypothetical protein
MALGFELQGFTLARQVLNMDLELKPEPPGASSFSTQTNMLLCCTPMHIS